MRRFAPRLPVTCHSLNPSPPLIRSSNNSLSYPSSRGYNLSLFVVLSFLYIYVCVCIFLSFKKFSKNYINCTRFIGVVSFRSENACFDEKRSPLSLSLFFGEDDRCRMERRERCNIDGVASFFPLRFYDDYLLYLFHPTFIVSFYPPPPPPPASPCFLV